MAKIGIYSGAFDPVHLGHIAFAEAAIDELNIDMLYLLAEGTPWRKSEVTDINHRQAMLELAVSGNPKIRTSIEGISEQHNVESTMRLFEQAHPGDQIVLLMGADVFMNIDRWAGYEKLISEVEFAIALRTEDDGEELIYKLQELPEAKVTKIVTDCATFRSTQIKQELSQGLAPKGLNPLVEDYIKSNNLYHS